MRIIVDINDYLYKYLKEDEHYPIRDTERLAVLFKVLVRKSKPIPKGLEPLFDKFIEDAKETE